MVIYRLWLVIAMTQDCMDQVQIHLKIIVSYKEKQQNSLNNNTKLSSKTLYTIIQSPRDADRGSGA